MADEARRQTITPYLCCKDAARALEFYKSAFGAEEVSRWIGPDGRVGHAEITLGGAAIFLADEYPEINVRSPQHYGGSPVTIHVYVDDVDALARRAVATGAKMIRPLSDQDIGDRNTKLEDPFGHVWFFATSIR